MRAGSIDSHRPAKAALQAEPGGSNQGQFSEITAVVEVRAGSTQHNQFRKTSTQAILLAVLMLASILTGSISPSDNRVFDERKSGVREEAPDWPDGAAAYDNMVTMTNFGYRRIDTSANENSRNWIHDELSDLGYEVERQPFTTAECNNCENIVVTINGTIEDEWIVVGAHHDAICYSAPPISGITYPGCTSSGAYDDGTGSGALLELARTFAEWNITPTHTWKLGWWDYEEWQGSGSSESGGQGSLHFVTQQIPENVNVTYINLDMFALNWPVPTPTMAQLSGCDEDYWTLYMYTSPVDDWSYYEDRGLEVSDDLQQRAESFQMALKEINTNLSHPTEWVRVMDDTKGNSDHFNFIMANHTATWLRGQHEYIIEEGDSCEQTPKHSQTDSVTTLNTMAGGRSNVESGLQTGLDIIATYAWWDRNASLENGTNSDSEAESSGFIDSLVDVLKIAFIIAVIATVIGVAAIIHIRRKELESGGGDSTEILSVVNQVNGAEEVEVDSETTDSTDSKEVKSRSGDPLEDEISDVVDEF